MGQLVDLDDLDVPAEVGAVLREVRVDVEHAAVIMPHHAEPVVLEHVGHPRGLDPPADLVPAGGIVVEHPGHLVKRDPRPVEDAGDLRHGTGGAVGQPLAGHPGPVAQAIERRVIDGRARLQVQEDHRDPGPPHHRQHRRRQGIRGHVQEDEVDVRLAKRMPGVEGLLGRVDQAEVDDHGPRVLQLPLDTLEIAFQPFLQPGELGPVGVQPDAEQADLERVHGGSVRGTTASLGAGTSGPR